jgi:hypothetical protein
MSWLEIRSKKQIVRLKKMNRELKQLQTAQKRNDADLTALAQESERKLDKAMRKLHTSSARPAVRISNVEAAKLPPELLEPPERSLRDMQAGETGYVMLFDLAVDSELGCWVKADAKLSTTGGGDLRAGITRREDGYHLLVHPGMPFTRAREPSAYRNDRWHPIAAITVVKT